MGLWCVEWWPRDNECHRQGSQPASVQQGVGAAGLDSGLESWDSGLSGSSPRHPHIGSNMMSFANEQQADGEATEAMAKQLADLQQQVQHLRQQQAQQQEEKWQLQQQLLQHQEEQQLLKHELAQLQTFAQQQEEKLAVSEEIISRMQGLANRLGSIRCVNSRRCNAQHLPALSCMLCVLMLLAGSVGSTASDVTYFFFSASPTGHVAGIL